MPSNLSGLFKILNFIVFSNLWIALSVASYAYLGSVWLKLDLNFQEVLLLFSATLVMYNFQRLFKLHKGIHHPRIQWMERNIIGVYGLIVFGIFGGFYISWTLFLPFNTHIFEITILSIVALTSILYATPFLHKKYSLRDIPYLKIHLIAFSWALVLVIFTLEKSEHPLFLVLEKYLYVLAITIPFDIRDIHIDETDKKTIPQVIGQKKARILSVILLGLSWALAHINSEEKFVSIFFLYLSSLIFCAWAHPKKHDLYFSFLIDGLPVFALGFYLITSI